MRFWTVHEPRRLKDGAEWADELVFIKDGFSWPALFIPLLWLLYRRLWLATLVYVAIVAALGAATVFLPLDESAAVGLSLIGNLYAALEGNDLRRRKLAKTHTQIAGLAAKSLAEGEIAFFESWKRGDLANDPPVPARPPARPVPPRPTSPQVLGLFPEPEGRR